MKYSQEVQNIEDRINLLKSLSNKTLDQIEEIRKRIYPDYETVLEVLKRVEEMTGDESEEYSIINKDSLDKIRAILWEIPDPGSAKSELDYYNGDCNCG